MIHAEDRERIILAMLKDRGFVSFRELDKTPGGEHWPRCGGISSACRPKGAS